MPHEIPQSCSSTSEFRLNLASDASSRLFGMMREFCGLARRKNVEYDRQRPGEACSTQKYTSRQCYDPFEHDVPKSFCLEPQSVRHPWTLDSARTNGTP